MEILNQMSDIARRAGEIMLSADRSDMAGITDAKEGSANFVTRYDTAVQDFVLGELSALLTEAAFVGEEGDGNKGLPEKGYAFVVDPIDGTTNFIRDFRKSAVSIGLVKDSEVIAGVVYDPYTPACYTAAKGEGAFLNGKPIRVSKRPFKEAVVMLGTAPYRKDIHGEGTLKLAREFLYSCADLRRSGSAALDICDVACGRAEIMCEMMLCPWDFAAGLIILGEAGGIACDFEGNAINPGKASPFLAANPESIDGAKKTVQSVAASL